MEGQLCSLTPRPPAPMPLLTNISRGAWMPGRHGPPHLALWNHPTTAKHPSRAPPASLVRACPSRPPLSLVLFRILLEAVCTPRHLGHLGTSSPSIARLCLHLFPVASGRYRGARLTRSSLPRFEDDGIQTPMAKQNMSLAAVAQVVFTSPLYRPENRSSTPSYLLYEAQSPRSAHSMPERRIGDRIQADHGCC